MSEVTIDIVRVDGGYRVAETGTHYIDILHMAYNWRVCETPKSNLRVIDRSWCYAGLDEQTFLKAYVAVLCWVGMGADQPEGWNKNVNTGEWYDNGYYRPSSDGDRGSGQTGGNTG